MAHTKRGRAKKALRDAREAEMRVVQADVDALHDDDDVQFYDEVDVDTEDLLPYIVDDSDGESQTDVDDVGTFDLPDGQ